ATFTGLGAGPHTIVVRDNFGCLSTAINASVTAGPVLTGTATSTSTACASVSNGTITVTPTTGFTGPFEYALNSGTYQSSNTFSGLAANNYTVNIRNTGGCVSADIPVTVAAGAAVTGGATSTSATCNGISNGTITVTPANGTAPYQYALNGGAFQSSNVFSGLGANTYTVTIQDAFGCTSAGIPVTVSQPAAVQALVPSVQNVTCFGGTNGVITAAATGGTTPYSYSLDNVTYQSSDVFTVPRGSYTFYVKDAMGCTDRYTGAVVVTEPAALTASVAGTSNATCDGGSDGVIEVTAGGGTAPYQYAADGTSFQPSNLLNVMAGTYNNVTIKDANGCTFVIPSGVVVGLTDNLTVSVTNPAPICEGSSVQLEATGNATGYSWTSPSGSSTLSGAASATPMASPRSTTTYTVAATLGVCTANESVTVTVLPAPVADAGADIEICYGQNARLQGSGGITYSWTPATDLDDPAAASPQVIKPPKTITYSLSVTDANNCASLTPGTVTVTVIPPIKVKVIPADTVVYAGVQFQLQATSIGTNYTWSPATGLSNPFIANPVVTAPLLVGAELVYTVTASTAAGCQGEGMARVRVYEGPDIYVVTAFTPNNDGRNDVFIPIPVGIKQLNYFRVYDRWGKLVFSTTTLNKGWDGKIGGLEQASGVYVWMVEGVTDAGAVITKKGTVTLIR
ncbi:MAG: gliding motility-associated C-terminal domain-containing protein, partial [Chitinophagaceae bacterium]